MHSVHLQSSTSQREFESLVPQDPIWTSRTAVAANDLLHSALHMNIDVDTSSASSVNPHDIELPGDSGSLSLSSSTMYARGFMGQNDIRSSNSNFFPDDSSIHETFHPGGLFVPDFAAAMFRVISHMFPRAASSPHLVILGNNSAFNSALSNMSHPSTLQLVRQQSIDHQIIYVIFHRLINDSDAVQVLDKPKTELDQIFRTGVIHCFSLDKRILSSLISSVPPPFNLALVQNIFRSALVLDNVPILKYILETNETDLAIQLFLLGGSEYYPLEYTSTQGHVQATLTLLDHGADPNRDLPVPHRLKKILGWPWTDRDPRVGVQILQLLIDHGLELKPASFSERMDQNECIRDEVSVLATHFLPKSFETFFEFCGLPRLLMQREWNDPSSKTLKAILNQALLKSNGRGRLWNSVLSHSLSAAVLRNRASAVNTLLSMDARPNTHCLISAAQSNNVKILKDFLSRGLDPNAKATEHVPYSRGGWNRDHDCTALSVSILNHSKGAFDILWERRFVSRLSHQPAGFASAFVAACEVGDSVIIDQLLSMPNFPRRETKLRKAIEVAIEGDQHHIIERLLSAGMRPNACSLLLAIQKEQLATVILLTRYMDTVYPLSIRDGREQENVILWNALRWGNQTVIELLLKMGQPVNVCNVMTDRKLRDWDLLPEVLMPCPAGRWRYTPLGAAILTGNPSVVKALMTYGLQAVLFRAHGTSYQSDLLYDTGEYGDGWVLTPLAAATATNDLPLIEEILNRGADPFDNSALFICAMVDSEEKIILLLLSAFRARYPDGAQSFGSDALYRAIRSRHIRLLELLAEDVDLTGPVQEECRSNRFSNSGNTVFTSPLGEAVRLHAESGGDGGELDYLLPLVKDLNAVVCKTYKHGNMSSLLYAISLGSSATVRKLHQAGADISLPAGWLIDRTPLQAASEFGSKDIVEYLLRRGADPGEPPAARAGGTALQLAAIKGNIGIATILLNAGADIDAPPAFCDGRTAFEGATEHGRIEMMIFLVGRGADLLSNGNLQYRRAVAFAEDNAQYAARKLADELYAKLLAKQGMSFIDVGADKWTGPNMSTFGGSL
jgi:ankyrin repeat protein